MFRWLNKQGVESAEGFSVQVLDRFNLEYRDSSGRYLVAKMDVGFTAAMRPCTIVDQRSIESWGGEGGCLTTPEFQTAKQRLAAAMQFQGVEIEFE